MSPAMVKVFLWNHAPRVSFFNSRSVFNSLVLCPFLLLSFHVIFNKYFLLNFVSYGNSFLSQSPMPMELILIGDHVIIFLPLVSHQDILNYVQDAEVLYIPGVMTPTEVRSST